MVAQQHREKLNHETLISENRQRFLIDAHHKYSIVQTFNIFEWKSLAEKRHFSRSNLHHGVDGVKYTIYSFTQSRFGIIMERIRIIMARFLFSIFPK